MKRGYWHRALVLTIVPLLFLLAGCEEEGRRSTALLTSGAPVASQVVALQPTEAPTAEMLTRPAFMVIANTGGSGVGLRSACTDASRLDAVGFAEGASVKVKARGVGTCNSWHLVTDGTRDSWVRSEYLADTPPSTPPPAPAKAATQVQPQSAVTQPPRQGNCDSSYPDVCIPRGAADYDCAGGSGNGPNYIRGPLRVLPPDPHRLDSDGDGVGCE